MVYLTVDRVPIHLGLVIGALEERAIVAIQPKPAFLHLKNYLTLSQKGKT